MMGGSQMEWGGDGNGRFCQKNGNQEEGLFIFLSKEGWAKGDEKKIEKRKKVRGDGETLTESQENIPGDFNLIT